MIVEICKYIDMSMNKGWAHYYESTGLGPLLLKYRAGPIIIKVKKRAGPIMMHYIFLDDLYVLV
jgi:hypothetical protein